MEQLEHFEVVPFDEQVLRRIEIDRFFGTGYERRNGWLLNKPHALRFAQPIKTVTLPPGEESIRSHANLREDLFAVDPLDRVPLFVPAFLERTGEQLPELLQLLTCHVGCEHLFFGQPGVGIDVL
ncbi:MAG: hypothetical protein FWC50_13685 [Planctomycetaceae bacterium]|nr:hypothetical protein [Planctomycetaceae bacterium]